VIKDIQLIGERKREKSEKRGKKSKRYVREM
jgi:hypothetical protein